MQTSNLKGKHRDDQYTDIKFFTSGGMGEIYIARDVTNNSSVVVKIIRINHIADEDLLKEEFKIAIALHHKNIVQTYYNDEFTDPSGKYFYAVMSFLDRGSLRKLIQDSTQNFSIDQCLAYFKDLLEGLQEAHKSIIHRDLKPENILISIDGNLQICDFGIAKYVGMLTRTKSFKGSGTYAYMPPECWNADTNTVQMDIYSLGFIFYEILTRQQAFKGTSEREFKDQHLYTPFPAISGRTDVPILIQEVIKKMTKKNPGDRYRNVAEILNVLSGISNVDGKTTNAIDSILRSAQKKAKEIADLELATQKIKDQQSDFERNLNFSIDELFNQFAEVGDEVNASLQEHKLDYKKFGMANPYANQFRLNFFDRVLDISFFNQDIKQYIDNEKKRQLDIQHRQYGMAFGLSEPDFIERDEVMLVGKATLNIKTGNDYYGYNLILRKEHPDDLYGKWWICKFSDNTINRNARVGFYYALVPPEFFVEYNIGRARAMHTRNMAYHFLTNEIAAELIAAMPQQL